MTLAHVFDPLPAPRRAHVIVVGNQKGGAGKSTVAMHLIVALMRMGRRAGAIDLDTRQRSLTRYIENRGRWIAARGAKLPAPQIFELSESRARMLDAAEAEDEASFRAALKRLAETCDFIVIDSPGGDSFLARLAHACADTLVTPLNDSFVDFDLLARIDPNTNAVLGPSIYAEMVWQARQLRAKAGLKPIDWIVLRNRLGAQQMHNKRKVGEALDSLSRRIGFRVAPGFSERVIFRELFPRGLTLLDLRDVGVDQMNLSNVAARQELREMMHALRLPGVTISV